jgi:hypothetical protein
VRVDAVAPMASRLARWREASAMPFKHVRARILATVLSCSALMVAAAPAAAVRPVPDPVFVDIWGCAESGGGQAAVPAGADLFLGYGWWTLSRGQQVAWLSSVRAAMTVDGVPVANPDSLWTEIIKADKRFWLTFWQYQYPTPLENRQSITVHLELTLTVPVYDGVSWYPAGTLVDSTCVITGTNH